MQSCLTIFCNSNLDEFVRVKHTISFATFLFQNGVYQCSYSYYNYEQQHHDDDDTRCCTLSAFDFDGRCQHIDVPSRLAWRRRREWSLKKDNAKDESVDATKICLEAKTCLHLWCQSRKEQWLSAASRRKGPHFLAVFPARTTRRLAFALAFWVSFSERVPHPQKLCFARSQSTKETTYQATTKTAKAQPRLSSTRSIQSCSSTAAKVDMRDTSFVVIGSSYDDAAILLDGSFVSALFKGGRWWQWKSHGDELNKAGAHALSLSS